VGPFEDPLPKTDRGADAHRHSVEKIFPRLGEADTTDNILSLVSSSGDVLAWESVRVAHAPITFTRWVAD
jgi:hypothetical protein